MPGRRGLSAVSDEPQSPFASKTIQIGDAEYIVTELSGKAYDECVELARVPVDEAHPFGIDAHLQLIFMTERAVVPKMTLADINGLPFTKRAALFDAVNDVHAPAPAEKSGKD